MKGWLFGFLLVLSPLFFLPRQAEARDPIQLIQRGMSSFDVLTLMGQPKERIEFESKREEKWVYTANSVSFKQGKVFRIARVIPSWERVSFDEGSAPGALIVEKTSTTGTKIDDEDLMEILEEIAAGAPDQGSSPKSPQLGKPIKNKSKR